MIPWLKDLLYDPQSFANFVRGGLFALGTVLQQTGTGGKTGWWAATVLQVMSLWIKAGDKNPPVGLQMPK